MLDLPLKAKHIIPPVTLILLLTIVELTKINTLPIMGFYTNDVSAGQYWRIITGQLTHLNQNHLLLNVLGLVLIWLMHGEYYRFKNYILINLFLMAFIGFLLAVNAPMNHHYAGYSGVIHGLLMYGGIIDITKRYKTGWLLVIGITTKIIHEQFYGGSVSTAALIDADVATNAHLFGVIAGALAAGFVLKADVKSA